MPVHPLCPAALPEVPRRSRARRGRAARRRSRRQRPAGRSRSAWARRPGPLLRRLARRPPRLPRLPVRPETGPWPGAVGQGRPRPARRRARVPPQAQRACCRLPIRWTIPRSRSPYF